MDSPKDVVVGQPADAFEERIAEALDVGLDELRELATELEADALLGQAPVDGLARVGD
jgi:uncharacterized protein YbjQ (UPF0145 family)